jgi:CBS domain containing-hemolysin-like protein
VTFEDLVEELVGDVVDEHDATAPGIRRQFDGTWLLSGLQRPDEIKAAIGVELPEGDDYETVAGLILQLLGRLPDVGDEVTVPGAKLRVERLDGRRIDRIRLTPLAEETEDRQPDRHDGGDSGKAEGLSS